MIFAGLGRPPREGETPTVVVEFVSAGKRSLLRDYDEKREEYLTLGVAEYWIIDPGTRCVHVYRLGAVRRYGDPLVLMAREGEVAHV